jgi:hypothetical protein
MAGMGFEFGSHTESHVDLGSVPLEIAKQEIQGSKRVLEDRLQRPLRWLAYPFGQARNFRAAIVPLLQEAGYEACWSGYGGFINAVSAEFVLPREPVPQFSSVLNLELHLTGCLDWIYAMKCKGRCWPQELSGKSSSPDLYIR